MKKKFLLFTGLLSIGILTCAQTANDPWQEIGQLKQKIRMLQSSNQQIKTQLGAIRKDMVAMDQKMTRSIHSADSVRSEAVNFIRSANEQSNSNKQEINALRSSVSFQQNLLVIALVLVVCLVLLFLWQRKALHALARSQEEDIRNAEKSMAESVEEISGKMQEQQEHFQKQVREMEVQFTNMHQQTEARIVAVKTGMNVDLGNLKDLFNHVSDRLSTELRSGLETEKRSREDIVTVLKGKWTVLDEKAESIREESLTFARQEGERIRKELAEFRKSLQEISRGPKARGNVAE